jgi:hypothetical protein
MQPDGASAIRANAATERFFLMDSGEVTRSILVIALCGARIFSCRKFTESLERLEFRGPQVNDKKKPFRKAKRRKASADAAPQGAAPLIDR